MRTVRLGSISIRMDYGLTASAVERDTGHRFLRITDIREGKLDWDAVPYCQCSHAESKKYALREGDIVFARTGSVGNSCLIQTAPDGAVFASYLIRIRPDQQAMDPAFLSYYFQTLEYWRQISGAAVGAVHRGLNASKLKQLRVPLLPLPEQKRIAAILAKADRLRRLRRFAHELSDSYLQSMFLEMFGDPASNPRGFPLARLGEVCETRLGKMLDAKQQTGRHRRPYLRNVNVQWGRMDLRDLQEMDFDEREREILRLRKGDVLICEGGEVGRSAIWNDELPEMYYQKALHRARPNPKLAVSEFIVRLMWCLAKLGGLIDFTSQVTIAHLTGVKLKTIEFPLPPLHLQRQFALIVHRFERLSAQQREAERQAEHLFQTLLHQAFQGEL